MRHCALFDKALALFKQMSLPKRLRSSAVRTLAETRLLHAHVRRDRRCCDSVKVQNALLSLYAKCVAFAMMDVCGHCAAHERVLALFAELEAAGIAQNAILFLYALRACAALKRLAHTKQLHTRSLRATEPCAATKRCAMR